MRIISYNTKQKFSIEEDENVGFYIYVFDDNQKCIADYLQDNLIGAKEFVESKYNIANIFWWSEIIEYEEVVNLIIKFIPDFTIPKEDMDLPYLVAGFFSDYIADQIIIDDLHKLNKSIELIEILHKNGSSKVKELATIGILESIQNKYGNNQIIIDKLIPKFGDETKIWWNQLNKFWNKEIAFVGQTIEEEKRHPTTGST